MDEGQEEGDQHQGDWCRQGDQNLREVPHGLLVSQTKVKSTNFQLKSANSQISINMIENMSTFYTFK